MFDVWTYLFGQQFDDPRDIRNPYPKKFSGPTKPYSFTLEQSITRDVADFDFI